MSNAPEKLKNSSAFQPAKRVRRMEIKNCIPKPMYFIQE
jgi:hypothetical protein